jgi:hypothetical protein
MGIGGLDDEFAAIFRRAFASRVFPPALVEKLGIQHVKGDSLPSRKKWQRSNMTYDRYPSPWTTGNR